MSGTLLEDIREIQKFAAKNGIDLEIFEDKVVEGEDQWMVIRAYITCKSIGLLASGSPGDDDRWLPVYPKLKNSYQIKGNWSSSSSTRGNWQQAILAAVFPEKFLHTNNVAFNNDVFKRVAKERSERINILKRTALAGLIMKDYKEETK